jgi:hypothetical protein
MTCFLLAGLQVFVCAPLALWMRPAKRAAVPSADAPAEGDAPRVPQPLLQSSARPAAFRLLVAGSGVSGVVTWGLPLYFVPMLQEWGLSPALAIGLASVQSYAIAAARGADLALVGRYGGMRLVLAGALMPPFILAILLIAPVLGGAAQVVVVAVAMLLYGFAAGLISAGRATLPLDLFGTEGYAATLGKLSLWLNLMFAFSPFLFAVVFARAGSGAALWFGLALSWVAAAAFWRLDRLVVEAKARAPGSAAGVEVARDTA